MHDLGFPQNSDILQSSFYTIIRFFLWLMVLGVRQHIKRVHEGVTYPCDKCDYEATQEGYLY